MAKSRKLIRSRTGRSQKFEPLESRFALSSHGIHISEVHFRPNSGDLLTDQYLEIRGEPNAVIPADTYLLGVESDGDGSFDNPGNINSIFDLGGLTFGENGYLVFLQETSDFVSDPHATVLEGTNTGFRGMPDNRFSGFTGQFESIPGSESFLLVDTSAGSNPLLSNDVDATDDGILDDQNWLLLDSVTYFKDANSSLTGDVAYGQIVFRSEHNDSTTIPAGATDIAIAELGYVARLGNSTGYEVEDWVAGTPKQSLGVYRLSDGDNGVPSPPAFAGRALNHVGHFNFVSTVVGTATPDSTVFLDRNGNYVADTFDIHIEPDALSANSQLINAYPGVTLTGVRADHVATGFSITSTTSSFATTDSLVFAYSGQPLFSDSIQLRADFYRPVEAISIDFIGGSSLGDAIGRLEAFDAGGSSLGVYVTSALARGEAETMTISRPQPDLAYVVASTDETSPNMSGILDNLQITQPEETGVVDGQGDYEITPVIEIEGVVLARDQATGDTEAISMQGQTVAFGVDLTGNVASQDLVAHASDGKLQVALSEEGFLFEDWGQLSTAVTWEDVLVGDITGDGRDDVVGRANGQWWVARSTGTGFVNEYWGQWSDAVTWDDVQLADVNGDGAADIVGRTSGQWWVAKSNGTFFLTEYWGKWSDAVTWDDVAVGDFDGDGQDDIAGRTSGQWWISKSQGTFFSVEYFGRWSDSVTWEDVSVGDFDGDGRSDIAGRANGQWWISRSQGTFFLTEFWAAWSSGVTWDDVRIADVNGDEQDDILGRLDGAWWVSQSVGDHFQTNLWGSWSNSVVWEDVRILDTDADGMDDVLGRTGSSWWASQSKGGSFSTIAWGTNADSANWMTTLVGDVNVILG